MPRHQHIVPRLVVAAGITLIGVTSAFADPAPDAPLGTDLMAPMETSLAMLQDGAPEKEWKAHFDLSGAASFGNTDTQALALGVKAIRERTDTVLKLDASYFTDFTNGDKTSNKFSTGVLHDWLVPDSPWFYFAQARFDIDEFQSWDQRLGGHAGAGLAVVRSEEFDLNFRFGAGATKEWGSADDDIRPEALLGFDLRWQMTQKQTMTADTIIYPDLEDTGEFRAVSHLDWNVMLDEEAAMSFHFGLENEYYSRTDDGIRHNDLRVVVGLSFDF